MIIVLGTARFADGEIERLKEEFLGNIAATRKEAGCEHYAYAVDLGDPNLLHISERWASEEAVDAHMTAPHMAEFAKRLGTAKIEAISVKTYKAEPGKTLMGE